MTKSTIGEQVALAQAIGCWFGLDLAIRLAESSQNPISDLKQKRQEAFADARMKLIRSTHNSRPSAVSHPPQAEQATREVVKEKRTRNYSPDELARRSEWMREYWRKKRERQ